VAVALLLSVLAPTSAAVAAGVDIPGRYVGQVAFTVQGTTYAMLSTSPDRGQTYGQYQGRRVSSGFGASRSPHPHSGTDWACPEGTPILAPWDGVVIRVDYDVVFGNHVLLRSSAGRLGLFGHLTSASVRAGARVMAGEQIALSGNTGSSTGPHLHLTMWTREGELMNPQAWMRRTGAPLFRAG
jgi:murein DD-endopeptidase MepM/ murein hydrolase activator NlpD